MKKIYILICIVFFGLNAKADQLMCLSESTAKKASNIINEQEFLILFCGCCSEDDPKFVKVISTKVIKDCNFEVVVTYETVDGVTESKSVDLAYVWMQDPDDEKGGITVGQALNLNHDPCLNFDAVEKKYENSSEYNRNPY